MQQIRYYILILTSTILFGACSDEMEPSEREVDFCVRAVWQNGLSAGKETRALSTNVLADVNSDIAISTNDYPTEINVTCSDGITFKLQKESAACEQHTEYWQYTPTIYYKAYQINQDNLSFTAKAVIKESETSVQEDRLSCTADRNSLDGTHMLFNLHHTQALLRFAFKVADNYDKIRFIKVTSIKLNGKDCVLVDKVLNNTNGQLIAYAYVDPAVVTTSYRNNVECTYNIYDKDAKFDGSMTDTEILKHVTRTGIVVKNTFKLSTLKDAANNPVIKVRAGYYYDLNVTLNPDYLYVLSEHDNEHITIK